MAAKVLSGRKDLQMKLLVPVVLYALEPENAGSC